MHSTTIAVDLAKSVFEVAVSQRPGKVSARRRLSRGRFSRFLTEQAPATSTLLAALRPAPFEVTREIYELEAHVREVEHMLETLSRESEILARLRRRLGAISKRGDPYLRMLLACDRAAFKDRDDTARAQAFLRWSLAVDCRLRPGVR
jgi:hypothetical protein